MELNDKYIKRYPEKDLVHILKESGYHSSEWEETDPEEDIVSTEATAEATEEATIAVFRNVDNIKMSIILPIEHTEHTEHTEHKLNTD
jgi:hypothetical protein